MYHELQSDNLQNSLIQLLGVDRKPNTETHTSKDCFIVFHFQQNY